MAETFMAQGRWDDLITLGEAHVDAPALSDGDRAWLCSLLASAFASRGEHARAFQYASRAVATWPSQSGPRYLSQRTALGRIGLDAGQRDRALAEFAAVRDAPEADATNLAQAAWGFYMAGDRAEAERVVARAIAVDPGYGNAYHLRGWLEMARGDFAAAADSLATAFERTPRSFGTPHQGLVNGDLAALYYSGVARLKLGQRQAAAATFGSLAAHCRRLQEARQTAGVAADFQLTLCLARVDARLGRPAPDLPRLPGDDLTYFTQAARLHALRGRRDEALRDLGQAMRLGHGEKPHLEDDPDFDSIRNDAEFRRLVAEGPPR
jgi:tetratricopeptide (TPR) repeat protein